MPFITYNGQNILFIHIPKCGGTFVERWMETLAPLNLYSMDIPTFSKCTPQHLRMRDINSLFHDGFFDYIFTIVRNPYTRLESEYRMRSILAEEGFYKRMPDFSLWLELCIDQAKSNKFALDNHMCPQAQFITNAVKVFRFEDGLQQILSVVSHATDTPPPQSKTREYNSDAFKGTIEWDVSDRMIVNEFFAADFRRFKYKMID